MNNREFLTHLTPSFDILINAGAYIYPYGLMVDETY